MYLVEETLALSALHIYGLVCTIRCMQFSIVLQGFWKALYLHRNGNSTIAVLSCCVSSIDATLTHCNIVPIMEEVSCWWKIGVPDPIREKIMQCYSTETERSCEAGKYWIETYPFASWESLALKLYYSREDGALEKVAQYLPRGTYIDTDVTVIVHIYLVISSAWRPVQVPFYSPVFLTKLGHNHTHFWSAQPH